MPDTVRRPHRPAHWERITLAWLDGLVGSRAALLALTDEPSPVQPAVTLPDAAAAAAYDAVACQVDRLAETWFDAHVAAVLDWALDTLWHRRPAAFCPPESSGSVPALAGGLVWVVGKANGLFDGDLRQRDVQRALGLRSPLGAVGLRVAVVVGRSAPVVAPRPLDAPDLTGFGEPALLTPATRRDLMFWRDLALDGDERP